MLNSIEVLKEARNLGSTANLATVEAEIAKHDYTTLKATEGLNYTVALWDKVSPINGVSAEQISSDVPVDGEVYLIYINGNLVYLQKHDPNQVGFVSMDSVSAIAKANEQVDRIVESKVDSAVMDLVLRELL